MSSNCPGDREQRFRVLFYVVAAIGKPVVLLLGLSYSWGVGGAWLLLPASGIAFFTVAFWWFLVSTRESGWY